MEDRVKKLESSLQDSEKKLADAQTQLTQFKQASEELSKKVESLQKHADEQKIENRRLKMTAFVEELINKKKIVPAQKEMLLAILMNVNGSSEHAYKIGEKEFKSLENIVAAFVEAGPDIALPTQESTEAGEAMNLSLDDSAKKYAREHKVSYKEALLAVAPRS